MKKVVIGFAFLFLLVGIFSLSTVTAGFFGNLFGSGQDAQQSPEKANMDTETSAFFEEFKEALTKDDAASKISEDSLDVLMRASTLGSDGAIIEDSKVRRGVDGSFVSVEEYLEEIKDEPVEIVEGGIKTPEVAAEELKKKVLPTITEDTSLEELVVAQEEILADANIDPTENVGSFQNLDDEDSGDGFISWIKRLFQWN